MFAVYNNLQFVYAGIFVYGYFHALISMHKRSSEFIEKYLIYLLTPPYILYILNIYSIYGGLLWIL